MSEIIAGGIIVRRKRILRIKLCLKLLKPTEAQLCTKTVFSNFVSVLFKFRMHGHSVYFLYALILIFTRAVARKGGRETLS